MQLAVTNAWRPKTGQYEQVPHDQVTILNADHWDALMAQGKCDIPGRYRLNPQWEADQVLELNPLVDRLASLQPTVVMSTPAIEEFGFQLGLRNLPADMVKRMMAVEDRGKLGRSMDDMRKYEHAELASRAGQGISRAAAQLFMGGVSGAAIASGLQAR